MKDPSAFRKRLSETTRSTNTLQSTFIQEKNMSVLAEKVISKGKFFFKKEKMLRWEYTDPFRYVIIMNNDEVFVKDESQENRFDTRSNRMFREINEIIIGCVRGTLLNDEKNFRSELQESNDYNLVRLFPKSPQMKDLLGEIRIFFDRMDYTVRILEMVESSGDNTRIVFTGTLANQPLNDALFRVR